LTLKEVALRPGGSFVRLNEIVNGRRSVTTDTALRLARLFETTPDFRLNGQLACDLWQAVAGGSGDSPDSPRSQACRQPLKEAGYLR
jgi:addiction module HigA family antidote